jgi:hypothetical protein
MAGIDFPADRIHSTTVSGEPKAMVLARLAARHPGARGHVFVEDKFSTLEKVRAGAARAPGTTGPGHWSGFVWRWYGCRR